MEFSELERYKKYLKSLDKILDKYFEDQKEYICCKKGCSHCCEKGSYPYSKTEFEYLLIGFFKLDSKEQQETIKRIKALKKEHESTENKREIMYRCPFLNESGICTVYDYRGLICRTFGLLKPDKNNEIIMPFCQSLGLNYSKIYNKAEKRLDETLIAKHNCKNRPKAYNIGLKTIMSKEFFADETPIEFGEIKSLIEWL